MRNRKKEFLIKLKEELRKAYKRRETMEATLSDLYLERWFRSRNCGDIVVITDNGDKIAVKNMSDENLEATIIKEKNRRKS